MRALVLAPVLLGACAEPEPAGRCGAAHPPSARFGSWAHDEFTAFEALDPIAPIASPQGGFGVLTHLETRGLAADGVDFDVTAVTAVGDPLGAFILTDTSLSCPDDGAGRFGPALVTFDQARYVVPEDLDALVGEEIELSGTVTDPRGEKATGQVRLVLSSL